MSVIPLHTPKLRRTVVVGYNINAGVDKSTIYLFIKNRESWYFRFFIKIPPSRRGTINRLIDPRKSSQPRDYPNLITKALPFIKVDFFTKPNNRIFLLEPFDL